MFFVSQSIKGEVPPPYTLQTIVLYFYFVLQVFFKGTLYFLLKYGLPPVLFTLTQVVLLLITSTFTRVQIQSNLGTIVQEYTLRLRKLLSPGYRALLQRHWFN